MTNSAREYLGELKHILAGLNPYKTIRPIHF